MPSKSRRKRAEDEAQARADHHWQPFLEKWKKELVAYSPKHEARLIHHGRHLGIPAVPSIRRALGHGKPEEQLLAVEILSRINCPASSHALAGLALFSKSGGVQSSAIQELKARDPRDYVER